MDFVKKQWRALAFGLACAAGLGLGIWQWMAASDVVAAMQTANSVGTRLKSQATAKMYNHNWIDTKRKEVAESENRFSDSLRDAQQRQSFMTDFRTGQRVERAPLVEGVLPKADRTQPKIEFRRRYKEEFALLFTRLKGDRPLSDNEVTAEVERAGLEEQARLAQMEDPWTLKLDTAGNVVGEGQTWDRARTVWADPEARAQYRRARNLLMYIDAGALAPHPLTDKTEPPHDVEIWQAQMSLWILQDVVEALARVNDERVRRLTDAGTPEQAWVAYMPIKRLVYLGIDRHLGFAGFSNSPPRDGYFYPSFTGRENTDKYFVVPVHLTLVVEAEQIPVVLDSLVRISFFTPVRIKYTHVRADWRQKPYVYGSARLVEVNIDLEGYYLHSVFGKWMPPEVKEQLTNPIGKDLLPDAQGGGSPGMIRGGGGRLGG
ncbi:MAG: hypothetical protein HUU22_06665 [Phycisphaerae bacterium]|nr:DUF2681 domain-containing protein [Phycisphaerae bacterium]NUQ45696.1 hypothetical protein [Phycisphaerae bacterium]